MDLFPLYNSLRIAAISTSIVFFLGIFFAHIVSKVPRVAKGFLDGLLTLPMVLPPTVVGFFLLKAFGPASPIGRVALAYFDLRFVMNWYAAILATTVVALPLMYRTARGAFELLDPNLAHAAQTLGLRNSYIFWRIQLPNCKQGILAGVVLAFARALGEYGATSMLTGYIPGKTATVATTVYQLWREGNDALAFRWVAINLAISFIVLLAVNLLERSEQKNVRNLRPREETI